MAVYIVTYDTKDDDARDVVRTRGTFVAESVYLVEHDGPATKLLMLLLAGIAQTRGITPDEVNSFSVLKGDERLAVVESAGDWNARGKGLDMAEIRGLLGPEGST